MVIGYMAYKNKKKDKFRQNQKPNNICELTVSHLKKGIQQKQLTYPGTLFSNVVQFRCNAFFGVVNNVTF